ncbi:hypothetical protein [Rhizobium leguminosarum]|uniref:hypothetical protein n=1 Tax=Rhizobium leguminosarum TaxID=384 RepID=UPI0028F41C56|nr:hypothetical protein [Rhizobium leguminosarum]
MTTIPFDGPPRDVDPHQASQRFSTRLPPSSSGSPLFRSQDARDFACLLDLDPDVLSWTRVGVELSYGGETYTTDFVVKGTDDRTFAVDVSFDLPRPPDWIGLAADRAGRGYRPVAIPTASGFVTPRTFSATDFIDAVGRQD